MRASAGSSEKPSVQRSPFRVAVVGLWHLGCVAAGCLARLGHVVAGIEDDPQNLAALRAGRAPLREPGLDELLAGEIGAGRLRFTQEFDDTVAGADVVCVAYDTPVTDRDEADMSIVTRTIERIAPILRADALLLVQSQVPVGTCRKVRAMVRTGSAGDAPEVAYVPENIRLGQAIEGYLRPDMVVMGADDPRAHVLVERLFAGIDAPHIRTDLSTAEMTKHAINTFLATSISFANELANLCQIEGVDAPALVSILRRDRRVGSQVPLNPGMGFAGGTLARDVKALAAVGYAGGYAPRLLDAVLQVNESQKSLPIQWLRQIYGTLEGVRVAVFGLTYKPGTSTLRRSDALPLIRQLIADGVAVTAVDPQAEPAEVEDLPRVEFTRDAYGAVQGTDAFIVMTPWPEFTTLDYERVRAAMRHPVVLDMPNALNRERLTELGFAYIGVGRGAVRRLARY